MAEDQVWARVLVSIVSWLVARRKEGEDPKRQDSCPNKLPPRSMPWIIPLHFTRVRQRKCLLLQKPECGLCSLLLWIQPRLYGHSRWLEWRLGRQCAPCQGFRNLHTGMRLIPERTGSCVFHSASHVLSIPGDYFKWSLFLFARFWSWNDPDTVFSISLGWMPAPRHYKSLWTEWGGNIYM